MKGIVITGVLSDGSFDPDQTVRYVFGDLEHGNLAYLDEQGEPLATATLRPMSREQIRRLHKKHTRRIANGAGQMVEELDREAYLSDMVDALILDWTGLYGQDLQPLECSRKAKLRLGDDRLTDMLRVATRNESVEADARSFRESA